MIDYVSIFERKIKCAYGQVHNLKNHRICIDRVLNIREYAGGLYKIKSINVGLLDPLLDGRKVGNGFDVGSATMLCRYSGVSLDAYNGFRDGFLGYPTIINPSIIYNRLFRLGTEVYYKQTNGIFKFETY